MATAARLRLVLLVTLSSACIEQAYREALEHFPDGDASSTGGATTTPTSSGATTTLPDEPPLQTVTGAPDGNTGPDTSTGSDSGDPATSTGEPANQAPTIEVFTASDDYIDEAGPLTLMLTASDDVAVVKVRLYLDDEEIAGDLTLASFPYDHDVLSAQANGDQRRFKVVVEDGDGLTAAAETRPITMLLPEPGVERCYFEDPDKGSVISAVSAIEYTPDAIYAVGTRGLKLTAWKLDPDDCSLHPGWPKSIGSWTGSDEFKGLTSLGAAVDVDEDGNLVVGGNLIVDGKLKAYVALLTATGSRLWEETADPGDELTSVAAGLGPHHNRVFVGGSRRTSDNPVLTDGAVWIFHFDGDSVFVAPPTILRAPFTPDEFDPDELNKRSEWVRALVIHPGTGHAVAVGEREYMPNFMDIYSRAFAVRIQPSGGVEGVPWTSSADGSFPHDAGRSTALCEDGFLIGGWTRDEAPNAEPVPMIFWLDDNLALKQRRVEPQLFATRLHGVACDREAKVVGAGSREVGSDDARVFSVRGPLDPRITYDGGVPGNDAAGAVACDPRGFCGWGGYRTDNGMPYAVVRVHHP